MTCQVEVFNFYFYFYFYLEYIMHLKIFCLRWFNDWLFFLKVCNGFCEADTVWCRSRMEELYFIRRQKYNNWSVPLWLRCFSICISAAMLQCFSICISVFSFFSTFFLKVKWLKYKWNCPMLELELIMPGIAHSNTVYRHWINNAFTPECLP